MKDNSFISEKYKKFLLGIVFEGQQYCTVSGADLSDDGIDKLLVDADDNILICSKPADLLILIQKDASFFDNKRLHEWAKEIAGIEVPYATISFDVLAKSSFDLNDTELFNAIYDTVGIVEDYAIQVSDEKLLAIYERDILLQFKDDLANYFLWGQNKVFKISVDLGVLFLSLKEIYERLKEKLNIYQ